jgi:hypothetical protein
MPEKENSTPRQPRGLFKNWLSLGGVVIAAGSVFSCLFLFATELFLPRSNPYMGILVYILAPIFFFLGLGLILAGLWMQRRESRGPGRWWSICPSRATGNCWSLSSPERWCFSCAPPSGVIKPMNTPTRSNFAARPATSP